MWPQAAGEAIGILWRELTTLVSIFLLLQRTKRFNNGVRGTRDALNPRASTRMFASWYVLMQSQQRSKQLFIVE